MKGKNFSLNSTKRNKNDYYQTPYSMTRQLLEVENFEGKVLEPFIYNKWIKNLSLF